MINLFLRLRLRRKIPFTYSLLCFLIVISRTATQTDGWKASRRERRRSSTYYNHQFDWRWNRTDSFGEKDVHQDYIASQYVTAKASANRGDHVWRIFALMTHRQALRTFYWQSAPHGARNWSSLAILQLDRMIFEYFFLRLKRKTESAHYQPFVPRKCSVKISPNGSTINSYASLLKT